MYRMRPMLATRGTTVPSGPEWLHEVKWDGMRVLVEVRAGRLRIFSRNENDVTVSFPELHGLAEALRHDVLLDGEVVAFADGVPSFGALAERMHVNSARKAAALVGSCPVTLLVFDLLSVDGTDLTGKPLSQRRERLESLGIDGPHWQVPATYDDGPTLLAATEQQGLEGVVSKLRGSR
jgi:bifunctional non-homologous end joining protein LigD